MNNQEPKTPYARKLSRKFLRSYSRLLEALHSVNGQQDQPIVVKEFWLENVKVAGKLVNVNLHETRRMKVLNGEELSKSVINASMKVLSVQFPDIGGWQDISLDKPQAAMRAVLGPSIQIHRNCEDDWIMTTSIGGTIRLYDSLFPGLTKSAQNKLAEIYALFSNEKSGENEVETAKCQRQTAGKKSGLFAVVFAVELATGYDPSLASFDESAMCEHFSSCLKKGSFTPFPKSTNVKTKRKDGGYFYVSSAETKAAAKQI